MRRTGLELLASALCLWAAAYHTPAGALARAVLAQLGGTRAATRPLLAYYSGGVYQARPGALPLGPPGLVPDAQVLAAVPRGAALARGVRVAYLGLEAGGRREPEAVAAARHLSLDSVDDTQALLQRLGAELGSEDAAVLGLFAGEDLARWAVQRARDEGRVAPTLEALAPQLPPSAAGAVTASAQALTLATAWGLGWPVPAGTPVSSPFGWRSRPWWGGPQFHGGVDLALPPGSPVRAAAGGVVARASEDAVNGRMVVLDHGRGVTTAYCHNRRLLVAAGQRVEAGALLSESGNSGRSTGPHLHYQLELGHQPVDPFLFRGSRPVLAPPAVSRAAPPLGPMRPAPSWGLTAEE